MTIVKVETTRKEVIATVTGKGKIALLAVIEKMVEDAEWTLVLKTEPAIKQVEGKELK